MVASSLEIYVLRTWSTVTLEGTSGVPRTSMYDMRIQIKGMILGSEIEVWSLEANKDLTSPTKIFCGRCTKLYWELQSKRRWDPSRIILTMWLEK